MSDLPTTPTPMQQPRRQRHLMDPNNLQASQSSSGGMSISNVQKWVMSTLAVTTILHLAGGLVLAARMMDTIDFAGQVGLVVIASLLGVLAIFAGLLIHQHRLLSKWLLAAPVLAAVFAWLVFGL
ncbi:hypothetical protein [Nocardioides pacificus]